LAAAGQLPPEDKDRVARLDAALPEIDAALFQSITGEVPAIRGDPLVVASVRDGVAAMAENYQRLKGLHGRRGSGVGAEELRELKRTHRRLVGELYPALDLEPPPKLL